VGLQTYITTCTLCEFKEAASREIGSLERIKKTADEEIRYREARGNVEKLKAYAASCVVCAFKQAALSEVSSYDENRKREEFAKQEASDYRMARGNREKLEKYIADCSARKCEFKEAARSELALTAQRDCDREMAAQFDKDVPVSIAFVPDTSALSDADIDNAIVACNAVRKASGLSGPYRRFTTQAGRAYSARAARRAASGNIAEARSDMNQAVALWNSAMQHGSGAAMNFLGAYAKGTFNNTSITYVDADFSKALDYWLKGAATGNLKSMRNAGGMLLEGPDTFPGVKQDIARGQQLLAKAAAQGEMSAAAALGGALFYG
jgi:TPR repeat protein